MVGWKHRVLDYDRYTNRVHCEHCGWVPAVKGNGGIPKCKIAKDEQRGVRPRNTNKRGPHGLTRREREALISEKQNCEICGTIDNLVIDHCHKTMQVRGVLCVTCNLGLGAFKDQPKLLLRAAEYLYET